MRLSELCDGIRLTGAARQMIMEYAMEEQEYAAYRQHFQRDRQSFFQEITAAAGYRQKLLYLFARFAQDAYEDYQIRGIADDIYFDTFSDLRIWSEVCYQNYGEYGIEEYNWLQEHVQLRLIRLGRLQFQPISFERDLRAQNLSVDKHQLVLNVHIPEGEPLHLQEVERSFSHARAFFRGISPIYTCRSWLLYPGLAEILHADSNILKFQHLFHIYEVDEQSRQAEQRIFNQVQDDPSQYGEQTSLQRAAKSLLLAGGKLGSGSGIYAPDLR